MSSNTIVNGAPMTILRGTQDLSIRTPIIEPEVIPTHCPKVYLFAQKGPTSPQLVVGNSRSQMYGEDTFDLRKPYATHQTVLSNIINEKGNAQMIERILPDDVGPKSNFLLCLDLLEGQELATYERDSEGKYKLSTLGELIPLVPKVTGAIGRWVVVHKNSAYYKGLNPVAFGMEGVKTGSQVNALTAATSSLYPILEFQASSEGEFFNNSGLRIWAPDEDSNINSTILSNLKAYPFRIQVIRRSAVNATPYIVQSEFAESYLDFTLKPYQIDPSTDSKVSLEDIFIDRYQNLKDSRFALKYGDFGKLVIYNDIIRALVEKLSKIEHTNSNTNYLYDFIDTPTSDTMWLYNFFSAKNSNGAPYNTLKLEATTINTVRLTENTNIYMSGGFDGTMFESPTPGVYTP